MSLDLPKKSWYKRPGLWALIALAAGMAAIHDRNLTLEYIKATTWPVVIGVSIFFFRDAIRERIGNVRKFKVGSAEAEFDAKEQLQEALEEAVPLTVRAHDETFKDGNAERMIGEEEDRRQAIERVINTSFSLGASAVRNGDDSPVAPVVTWSEDGFPTVTWSRSNPEFSDRVTVLLTRLPIAQANLNNAVGLGDSFEIIAASREVYNICQTIIHGYRGAITGTRYREILKLREVAEQAIDAARRRIDESP